MRLGVAIKSIDWPVYVNNVTNAQPFLGYGGGVTPTSDSLRRQLPRLSRFSRKAAKLARVRRQRDSRA